MSNLVATKDYLLRKLDFWGELSASEQRTILVETQGAQLGVAKIRQGHIDFARHMTNLHPVLRKSKRWVKYCSQMGLNYRTVRRHIEGYQMALKTAHPNIIDVAATRGTNMFSPSADPTKPLGDFTEALKALPPPKDPDPKAAVKYVEAAEAYVQKHPPRRRRGVRRVETARRWLDAFQTARNAYKSISDTRARRVQALRFIRVLMGEFGLAAGRVEPETVPAEYLRRPGRPGQERDKAVGQRDKKVA